MSDTPKAPGWNEAVEAAAKVVDAPGPLQGYEHLEQNTRAMIRGIRDQLAAAIRNLRRPTPAAASVGEDRDARQKTVADWCAAAFGIGQASSIEQRGIRLLEEAIEAYQACGASADMAHKMVDYIFARPAGTIIQELGGVGVTALALANAAGVSADDCEAKEVARVLSKPLEHFTKRNQAKNDAGFAALRTVTARG